MTRYAEIVGTGGYLPPRVVTNADLEKMVDTTDEWIVSRTGISERRVIDEGVATSDLVCEAVTRALSNAGISVSDVDQLIVATSTPDYQLPSCACVAQGKLGMSCPSFDVNAVCSGFIYALQVGASAIESGRADTVVIAGADALSRVIDWEDRGTCVLFGDGAGAVVLRASQQAGVSSIVLGADGTGVDQLKVPGGGNAMPSCAESLEAREHYVKMNGREVFKFAVRVLPKATNEVLAQAGYTIDDIDWLVPHQANKRILDTVEERLGIDDSKVFSNLERTGNTSAASIPLALDELYTGGHLKPGDLVALVGFGAGLTWGAALLRWTMAAPHKEG